MTSEQQRTRAGEIILAVSFRQLLYCLSLVVVGRLLIGMGATTIGLLIAGASLGTITTVWWFEYND